MEIMMEKFWPHTWRHSGLYIRNTAIVFSTTLFVFAMAVSIPFHWFSIFVSILGLYFSYLLWSIYLSVHPRRMNFMPNYCESELSRSAKRLEFLSWDGLNLCGWLLPGDKPEIILLLHQLGDSSASMFQEASMLHKAGYSVMLLDLRAHGNSEGDTLNGHWEANDVLSAIDFLASLPGIDATKIGVWGIALGGQVALKAAVKTKAIRVLVLENLEPATLADRGLLPKTWLQRFGYGMNYFQEKLLDFMCGVNDREGVVDILHLIYPRPVLFISTAGGRKTSETRRFFEAARRPKTFLDLSQIEHPNRAIYIQEYREQILQLFDQAFLLYPRPSREA